MAATKGNKFWEARSSHGRKPKFETSDDLWDASIEYFQWIEDNPLWENKVAQFQGVQVDMPSPVMRAMTIGGLCLFLDISEDTFANYRKKQDFLGITSQIVQVIYDQKFSGAAAGLLNASIIARDLGLKEATSNEHSGPNGGPIGVSDMSNWSLEEVNAYIDANTNQ